MKFSRALALFLFLTSYRFAGAYQDLSVNIGGGYSANLFADSFNIGNSFLVNGASYASVYFQETRLKLFYDISYFEYDTDNRINNILHVPGAALYRRNRDSRMKWGLEVAAAIKDYVDPNSNFDNYRIFAVGDLSYYLGPGLQALALYRLIRSRYSEFGILDNSENMAEAGFIATLKTRTTLRGKGRYTLRQFDEGPSNYHSTDLELGVSQSIDLRSGLSLGIMKRWSGGDTRPLLSYYVISGITSYWDPWDGNQVEMAVKRILPFAMVGRLEGGYWNRRFAYDQTLQDQLQWLSGKTGRRDEGWMAKAEVNRQFKLRTLLAESFKAAVQGGYATNRSGDQFYEYHNFFATARIEVFIF